MDIEAFKKEMKPSKKRSRLEPFRAQILELKVEGYADWQVRKWLAENGVEVTRQAVQQFVSKHTSTDVPRSSTSKPSREKSASTTKPSTSVGFEYDPSKKTEAVKDW